MRDQMLIHLSLALVLAGSVCQNGNIESAPIGFSYSSTGQNAQVRTIRVWLDANVWNEVILLKQLNAHGAAKHWQFQTVAPGETYDYRIVFDSFPKDVPTPYGNIPAHDSSVTVYDATGQELFSYTREGRWTEKGASDAAAKEIIKRLAVLNGK
jgi:hypothetical protein